MIKQKAFQLRQSRGVMELVILQSISYVQAIQPQSFEVTKLTRVCGMCERHTIIVIILSPMLHLKTPLNGTVNG